MLGLSRRNLWGRAGVCLAVFMGATLTLAMAAPVVYAQASLYLNPSEGSGVWEDYSGWCVNPTAHVSLPIRLSNQTAEAVAGFANGLCMYIATADGGQAGIDMTASFLPLWWDSSYVGWQYVSIPVPPFHKPYAPEYTTVFTVLSFGIDGSGADTVALAGAAGETTSGFAAGWDEILIRLNTYLYYPGQSGAGKFLCVDSCFFPPSGIWKWAPQGVPEWGGPYCFALKQCWPVFTTFVNTPLDAATEYCQSAVSGMFTVECEGAQGPGCFDPVFTIVGNTGHGQARLESVGYSTCRIAYDPVAEDIGQTITVTLEAEDTGPCVVPDYHDWHVTVLDQCTPVQFAGGGEKYVIETGDPLTVTPEIADSYEQPDHVFGYYTSIEDPDPPCSFNTTTGALTYEGTAADTGLYYVYVTVTEGNFADTTGYYIYHYDTYICGNINHRGSIDISDLVWLVNYMFKNGPPPVTYPAGDLDCSGEVDIADLVYLVNFMFKQGPEPCEGAAMCPE